MTINPVLAEKLKRWGWRLDDPSERYDLEIGGDSLIVRRKKEPSLAV